MECIPNPFTTESFVLIDSNQTSIKICGNIKNITIDIKHCHKDCPKKCLQNYNKLKIETSINNYNGDSYLKIRNEKKKKFSYKAESQLSLIKYIADLGGLFGLYLGISFIEMGKLIKYLISLFKESFKFYQEYENFSK